jgi:hypothetical protein
MHEVVNWPELLEALSVPFPADAVSWRAGSVSRDRKRAQALPYAEPRVYEDRLNAVCPGDWSVVFRPWGESKLICELTIHGVTRSSTGEYEENARGAVAQGTAAEAQAFKRACSKFGLGRYLYDIPLSWMDYDEEKKRLLETPQLPARFLPKAAGRQASAQPQEAAPKAHDATALRSHDATALRSHDATALKPHDAPALEQPLPLLSGERAEAMARELEKLGVARREQLRLAAATLGKPVSAFTQLSEGEALEVWAKAKQTAKRVA